MSAKQIQSKAAGQARTLALARDEKGFFIDPKTWSRSAARMIAELEGVGPLGPDHWAVIYYLREHYSDYQSLPPMSSVCRVSHLGKHAVHGLFGGCIKAWQIAGLPNPGDEALAHMT